MSTTDSQAADVNAVDETVETGQTTAEDTSSKETKETKSTLSDQEQADKDIAKDLLGDSEDEADDTDETKDDEKKDDETDDKKDDQPSEAEQEAERQKGAEARKQSLQNEIRELVAKRNEARAEYEQQIAKSYRTETAEELEAQGLSPEEAEVEQMKQESQMRDFNIYVADLNSTLNLESLQVMQDFPVFDPDSADYDKDFAGKVRDLYEKAAQPKVDKNTGLVISSNMPPYEFYKAFADTRTTSGEKSREEGKIEGQKAADANIAAAETQSSTAPRTKKTDPFLAGLLSKDD